MKESAAFHFRFMMVNRSIGQTKQVFWRCNCETKPALNNKTEPLLSFLHAVWEAELHLRCWCCCASSLNWLHDVIYSWTFGSWRLHSKSDFCHPSSEPPFVGVNDWQLREAIFHRKSNPTLILVCLVYFFDSVGYNFSLCFDFQRLRGANIQTMPRTKWSLVSKPGVI